MPMATCGQCRRSRAGFRCDRDNVSLKKMLVAKYSETALLWANERERWAERKKKSPEPLHGLLALGKRPAGAKDKKAPSGTAEGY